MFKHHVLGLVLAVSSISTFAQPAKPMASVDHDVHAGYDYATKTLAHAHKDCKAVRATVQEDSGSVLVQCLSNNGKDDVHWRITPRLNNMPDIELVARNPSAATAPSTPQAREALVNRYAEAIIRDYRYECEHAVKVTTQEDNSLVVVCTSRYGREPVSYQLIETPGAYLNARVVPIQ